MARGKYFEEFEIGEEVISPARTITEADVVMFAALTGDFNQLHTDEEFAKATPFGRRIAHGLLVLSDAVGLLARLGFIEGTALAFRELSWKFSLPVFMGDTVHVKARCRELKPMARLGGGLVIFDLSVVNQEGKTVQKGEWHVLMASKPASNPI